MKLLKSVKKRMTNAEAEMKISQGKRISPNIIKVRRNRREK